MSAPKVVKKLIITCSLFTDEAHTNPCTLCDNGRVLIEKHRRRYHMYCFVQGKLDLYELIEEDLMGNFVNIESTSLLGMRWLLEK